MKTVIPKRGIKNTTHIWTVDKYASDKNIYLLPFTFTYPILDFEPNTKRRGTNKYPKYDEPSQKLQNPNEENQKLYLLILEVIHLGGGKLGEKEP